MLCTVMLYCWGFHNISIYANHLVSEGGGGEIIQGWLLQSLRDMSFERADSLLASMILFRVIGHLQTRYSIILWIQKYLNMMYII